VQPYAISRDSPWTHVAWTQALDLNIPLLSDWNADATKGFGVAFEHRGLRDVSARSAFLIGEDGVIRAAWSYQTSELPDFDTLLEAVRAMA
jgi:peroxiredoxin